MLIQNRQKQQSGFDRSLNTYDIAGSRPKQFIRNSQNRVDDQTNDHNNNQQQFLQQQQNQKIGSQNSQPQSKNHNLHNYRHFKGVQDSLQLFQNEQEQQQNRQNFNNNNRNRQYYDKPNAMDENELRKSNEANSLEHFKPVLIQNKYDDINRFYNNIHRQNIQPKSQLKEQGLLEFNGSNGYKNVQKQEQTNRQISANQMQQVLQQNEYQLNARKREEAQDSSQAQSSRILGRPSSMKNILDQEGNSQQQKQPVYNRRHFNQNQEKQYNYPAENQDTIDSQLNIQEQQQNSENQVEQQKKSYQQQQQQQLQNQNQLQGNLENQKNSSFRQSQQQQFYSQKIDSHIDQNKYEENQDQLQKEYSTNQESQNRYEDLQSKLNQKAQNIQKTFVQNDANQIQKQEQADLMQQKKLNQNVAQSAIFSQKYNQYNQDQKNHIRSLKGNNSSQIGNIFGNNGIYSKPQINNNQDSQKIFNYNNKNLSNINDRYGDQQYELKNQYNQQLQQQQQSQNQNQKTQNNLAFLQQQTYLPGILQGNRRKPANGNQTRAHQSSLKDLFDYQMCNQSSVI